LGKKRDAGKNRGDNHPAPKSKVDPADVVVKVEGMAAPLCESEGMELVYVEFQREAAGWVLRSYLAKAGGVTLDDCAKVSRQLGDILDAGLDSVWPYHLEVSSPGEQRPLGRLSDFEKYSGHLAKVKTGEPIKGQKNFKGILKGVDGEAVHLLMEDKTVTIPFQEIVRARLA
jgi:ribosome maturation factor RimP